MLDFLTLKPEVFGLDISDLSLKIAKLKKKRGVLSLMSFGKEEIKPGIIKEGEIQDEESVIKVIKTAVNKIKGEKLKTKYVIASLPEEKSFLQVIQMPKMAEEELKSAIQFEAENYIPLPIEEVYLDFQVVKPISNHPSHLDVLIVAVPKKIVNSYVSCFKKAGLIPYALEIESQAMARAIIKNEMSPSPVLLIDFGKSNISFIIFSGYSLRFTCSIPISSQQLTRVISEALKVDLEKAEKLKIKYGLKKGKKDTQSEKIFQAITPILTDLIKEIKKYLSFYQTHTPREHLSSFNGKGVGKIFLCGGGANLKGLDNFLSSELKIPVELGNPWVNIGPEPSKKIPKLLNEESLAFTAVLGLALRGIKGR